MNTTSEIRKPTEQDIIGFCEALTAVVNYNYFRHGDNVNSSRFVPEKGGRVYKRIIRIDAVGGREISHSGSAHCFVKLDDGTLWKPAGLKGPAKNFPRGSVFDVPASDFTGR